MWTSHNTNFDISKVQRVCEDIFGMNFSEWEHDEVEHKTIV